MEASSQAMCAGGLQETTPTAVERAVSESPLQAGVSLESVE